MYENQNPLANSDWSIIILYLNSYMNKQEQLHYITAAAAAAHSYWYLEVCPTIASYCLNIFVLYVLSDSQLNFMWSKY